MDTEWYEYFRLRLHDNYCILKQSGFNPLSYLQHLSVTLVEDRSGLYDVRITFQASMIFEGGEAEPATVAGYYCPTGPQTTSSTSQASDLLLLVSQMIPATKLGKFLL